MEDFEPLDIGDKVKHPKFGVGTVTQRFGETETQKVVVKFGAEYGEKKLVTKIAKMKLISERPVLTANPAAPGTFPAAPATLPPITAVPAAKAGARPFNLQELDAEGEDAELEDDDDDADDDENFGEDEGETGEEDEEE